MGGGGGETPDETPQFRALAEQSAQYFNRYANVFRPLEDMYIQQVFQADDASQYAKAMDAGSNAAQREFSPQLQKLAGGLLARGGVDPSSGAFSAGMEDGYSKLGTARGLISADAGINNTDRYLGGVQNVIKMGQGVASEAMQGQIGLTRTAEDKARSKAMTDFSDSMQGQNALGTAAGMAGGLAYNYFGPNKDGIG
jgi:hypothetical protein